MGNVLSKFQIRCPHHSYSTPNGFIDDILNMKHDIKNMTSPYNICSYCINGLYSKLSLINYIQNQFNTDSLTLYNPLISNFLFKHCKAHEIMINICKMNQQMYLHTQHKMQKIKNKYK
eukprot:26312_1